MRLFECAVLLCISAGEESASAAKEAVYEEDSATPGIFLLKGVNTCVGKKWHQYREVIKLY